MEEKELKIKIREVINNVDKDKYPRTYSILEFFSNFEDEDTDYIDSFCLNIIESDGNYPINPSVAKLLEEVLLGEIEKGNDDAMNALGAVYYSGRIGEQNYNKAVHYYEMAAKCGNRQAQENLGYCYYYGRLGEADYKKAYHFFIKGALDNRIISLYKIGDMYKNGYYVEKDEKQAYCIYKRCIDILDEETEKESGADVYMRLADCYFKGIGTLKNFKKALEYYQKAEGLYYPRIKNGDFMHRKQFERAIAMQELSREEIKKGMPKYDWVKED